ncbi:MAG: TldD/PmbA family protein [Dehalococcoidales bacterium]|nr:MAG: TldD/PmbA family protein [Dehalococcoidales bacterium]
MERILNEAKKVTEEAEVFCITSETTPVQFEANRLKHVQSKQSTNVALRIIKNGRIGYATSTNLKESRKIVDSAVETAEFGMKAEFEFPSLDSYPTVVTNDPAIRRISTEEMTELGEKMISSVRENNPELQCEANISKGTISVRLINSRGGQTEYRKSIFSLGVEGQLIRGTDMLFVGEGQSSCHPIHDISGITEIVLQQLEFSRNNASIKTDELPVIFTPRGVASALVQPLMAGLNGKLVLEGSSPLVNKLGEKSFDNVLSIFDDPTIDFQPGSRPFDDEGVASQRTPLIENGVVSNFLYDLQTAALAGKKSTGNGERHGGLPSPAVSTFIVSAGNTNFNDMVADIKEGLVIEYLMGAGQGNTLGGDFSGNVLLGYKIENGKIVGRVKDTMVAGNVYQVMNRIAAIGSETVWVGGMLKTPPVYFSNISVSSR